MLFSQIRQYVKGVLANSFINKSTLDKLGENNNGLTFNGNNIEPPSNGKAESSAIAPVFDDTETYAAGDRVTYEDELYVFNKAHTGAWAAADADKSDVDSEIPDKLTSQQMQDIKDAFSGMNKGAPLRMMHYSTEEQVVGTWIDGKPIYQKTVNFGALPNATEKIVAHNINNIALITNIFGIFYSSVLGRSYCIPWVGVGSPTVAAVDADTQNIRINVSGDRRSSVAYVTLQYTKTTDTPQ